MTVINHDQRSYMELRPEELQKLRKGLSAVMGIMEDELARMAPEQRARTVKELEEKGLRPSGSAPKDEVRYVPLNWKTRTGKWMTSQYEARIGRERVASIWVAEWKTLGIDKKEFETLEAMQRYGKEMLEGLPPKIVPKAGLAVLKLQVQGLPVRVINYANRTRVVSETEYSDVQLKSVSSLIFAVPSGYQKRDLASGGQAPAGRPAVTGAPPAQQNIPAGTGALPPQPEIDESLPLEERSENPI